ncbi:MAG TPA: mycofactocin biosynthesis peptidyl-dipeptidase MftE [Acidimicrobiales bacterium]
MGLGSLAWPEVADRARWSVVAVPLGSTEQHGPHLPLSTDTDIAVALCARLEAEVPEVLAAPPICYGSSGEHRGFAGTLSIGQHALEAMLVELCRSADEFSGVMIVSTHGGNRETVERSVALLRSERRKVAAWFPRGGDPCDSHAGRVETSVQLALRPERVRRDRLATGDTRPLPDLMPVLRQGGVLAVSASGTLGDPVGSTSEIGQQMLQRWTDDLVEAVRREWEPALR